MAVLAVLLLMSVFCFGLTFTACAPQLISWHAASARRAYPDPKAVAMADRIFALNPLAGFFMGSYTRFVTLGPEHPEAFPRLMRFYRVMGLVTMAVFMFVLVRD